MSLPLSRASLCAAMAAPLPTVSAAQSPVVAYGLLDVVARYSSSAGGGNAKALSDGAYTGSRLGFKGSEDLGGGLRAVFSLEMGVNLPTGLMQQTTATAGLGQSQAQTGRIWGRESLVGLASSSLGTVTLGRQYTVAHQMSGRFQPQSNPNDPALSVFSGHHVARQDNMVKYSHSAGPLAWVLSVTGNQGNGKAWGAAAAYSAGPLDLVGYAMAMDINAAAADARKIVGLGVAYAATPALKLFLGGMQREHAVSLQKNTVLTTGFNFHLTDLLVLTAGYTDDSQTGINAGHRRVSFVGANYWLSKRTDVYTELDRNSLSGAYPLPSFMAARGDQTGLSVGLRHRF